MYSVDISAVKMGSNDGCGSLLIYLDGVMKGVSEYVSGLNLDGIFVGGAGTTCILPADVGVEEGCTVEKIKRVGFFENAVVGIFV